MLAIRRIMTVAAIGGLFVASAVSGASAATSHSSAAKAPAAAARVFTGGTTRITTGPGIAAALLKNGIVTYPTKPARQSQRSVNGGSAIQFTFPVASGQIGLTPLGGNIYHKGGILFVNKESNNYKAIELSSFVINLNHATVFGIVNGAKVRVPLFRFNASQTKLWAGTKWFTANGVGLTVSTTGAAALNTALGTSMFTPGLALGTARTVLRV